MTCTRCDVFSRDRADVLQGPLTWPQEPRVVDWRRLRSSSPRRRPAVPADSRWPAGNRHTARR